MLCYKRRADAAPTLLLPPRFFVVSLWTRLNDTPPSCGAHVKSVMAACVALCTSHMLRYVFLRAAALDGGLVVSSIYSCARFLH
jgi:hypothetical protein